MTLYEFRLLSQEEQANTTWQGEFFLSRETIEHTILLYKVQDFYVEVYYNNAKNEIDKLNPFSSKNRLAHHFDLQQK